KTTASCIGSSTTMSTDRIEKRVVLRAPRSRVWRAIADAKEFGTWFGMKLEGAFAAGRTVRGRLTIPHYDHLTLGLQIERVDAAPVFAALGDTLRLGLLGRLSADGPLSIRRLSEGTGVTRQAITRHLEALGRVGLVRDARRGRERVFSLDAKRLEIAHRYLDR